MQFYLRCKTVVCCFRLTSLFELDSFVLCKFDPEFHQFTARILQITGMKRKKSVLSMKLPSYFNPFTYKNIACGLVYYGMFERGENKLCREKYYRTATRYYATS